MKKTAPRQIEKDIGNERSGKIARVIKKYGHVLSTTLLSQGISVGNLALLYLFGTEATDIYSIGLQVGNGCYAGVILGVVYMLAIGRPDFKYWSHFLWGSALLSPIVGLIAAILIRNQGLEVDAEFWQKLLVLASFSIGGSFLCSSGIHAVKAACYGRPVYLAGITIIPNIFMGVATGFMLLAVPNFRELFFVPAFAWCFGHIIQSAYFGFKKIDPPGDLKKVAEKETVKDGVTHAFALLIGVGASTILPTFYLTAMAKLATGSATIFFLSERVGSALVGVGVNSLLLVRHNWRTQTAESGEASTYIYLTAGILGAASLLCHFVLGMHLASIVLYIFAWLANITAAPIVLREVNARRQSGYILIKTVADVIISCGVAYYLYNNPSITGFFSAYAISQCTTGFVCSLALKNYRLTAATVAAMAVSVSALLWGW